MPELIDIRDVSKRYHLGDIEVQALNGVSLTISQGEFVAIMGPSGSGKSTLMNILGCLDKPTGGRYLLGGVDVGTLDEATLAMIRSRCIGFVFQSFNLLARTSALENVELPLFYSGWTAQARKRAHGLLTQVGLRGREQSNPNQLSGGQQQRVAIARALVNQPPILVADEPTGNLDSRNSAEIMEIIRALNRHDGLTVILVTHEMAIASYADRVITFRDGRVVTDERTAATDRKSEAVEPSSRGSSTAEGASSLAFENEAWALASMTVRAALRALRRNKLRAVLTMLGIFIGVAAVVAMAAVGEGARMSVAEKIKSLGTNLVIVMPGTTTSGGVRAGSGSNSKLTVQDALAIKDNDPAVMMVSYDTRQSAQVVNAERNWNTIIEGTTPDYLSVREWPLAGGRSFTGEEAHSAATVCVLGQTVVNNLFGESQDPIGSAIRIKNVQFRVIGVLTVKGQNNSGQDQDDVVLIPFQTAERKVIGSASAPGVSITQQSLNPFSARINALGSSAKLLGKVNRIYAKTSDADLVDLAIVQLSKTLRERHHLRPGSDDDFTVRNLADIARTSEDASRVMTMLLAAIASISLLVGGIGIMNIMLVSVTERTREIGIRMAIGARRLYILLQFLVEAVILSLMGGLAGALLGIIASNVISVFASWPTLISPAAVGGGFLFSVLVGVFFGYYPARKASSLNPIEALRYE